MDAAAGPVRVPFLSLRPGEDTEALRGAVMRVIDRGWFILGPELAAFEVEFALASGAGHAIGVNTGTDAIALLLRGLGIGPGDEVITAPLSAAYTALAVMMAGARPVFADIDPQRHTMAPDQVEAAITSRTAAIMPVHLFGQPADMAPLQAIAARHGLALVEDAAQAHLATCGGRPVGQFGAGAAFSFYPTKNLGALGDAGAITTDDAALADRLRRLRNGGQRARYQHDEFGVNSRLDEMQAAILRVQLPELDGWADHRRAAGSWYADAGLARHAGLPEPTPGARPAWGLYVIRAPAPDALAEALNARGIGARGYYRVPIHQQPVFAAEHGALVLPGTEEAARTHLAIPMSAAITRDQVEEVVAAIGDATA